MQKLLYYGTMTLTDKNKTVNVEVTFSEFDQQLIMDEIGSEADVESLIYNVGLQVVSVCYVELKKEQQERFKNFRK